MNLTPRRRLVRRRDTRTPTAAPPDDGPSTWADAGVPNRAGVLVVRIWSEGHTGDRQIRLRMLTRRDVHDSDVESVAMSSVPQALRYVGEWLESFQNSVGDER